MGRAARSMLARGLDAAARHGALRERTSPAVKVALKSLYARYRADVAAGRPLPTPFEAGFRIFSQFDEDGIVLLLLAAIGMGPGRFVDLGAGDGIAASNCANLAFNLGFHGLFVDADEASIRRGERAYAHHEDTALWPPIFRHEALTRENVNGVVRESGFAGEIDLLSLDVDGNEYWLWAALECISPRIVVVETHVEFGMRPIVVPYDPGAGLSRGAHPQYAGASPLAMTRLAEQRGYRLVAGNRFGFNAFYVRNDLAPDRLPAIEVEQLLRHDRNHERARLFEPIAHLPFETV